MHYIQHQERIPRTIPKNHIADHKIHTVRIKYIHYHSSVCPFPLERSQHLPSATTILLSLPSHTANLHTLAKIIDQSKFVNRQVQHHTISN